MSRRHIDAAHIKSLVSTNLKNAPELTSMEIQGRPTFRPGASKAPSDHRRLRRILAVPAMIAVGALTLLGPAATAEAESSAPRTHGVTRAAAPASGVTLQTEGQEPTASDLDLLLNVRLAGLWEIPAGQMAIEKGVSPRVRQIGQMIAAQHVRLDALNNTAAKKVGYELPDRPTATQVRWLNEMKNASGSDFDDIYVMRLRVAHGKIFPVIGAVRASTTHDDIRALAQSANNFVLTHITLLESTDLVSYEELPKAYTPVTVAADPAQQSQSRLANPVIWLILATALIAGAVFTTRMVRPQAFGGRPTRSTPRDSEYSMDTRSRVRPADDFYPQPDLRLGSSSRSRH
jgi:putative membrane protein